MHLAKFSAAGAEQEHRKYTSRKGSAHFKELAKRQHFDFAPAVDLIP